MKDIFQRSRSFRFEIPYTIIRNVTNCPTYTINYVRYRRTLKGWYAGNSNSFVRRQHLFQFDEWVASDKTIGSRFNDMKRVSANPTESSDLISADDTFKGQG